MTTEKHTNVDGVNVEALADGIDRLIKTGQATIEAAIASSQLSGLVGQARRGAVVSKKLRGSARARISTFHVSPETAVEHVQHA